MIVSHGLMLNLLFEVVKHILVLTHSNAEEECIFRPSLSDTTILHLIFTCKLIYFNQNVCFKFERSQSLLKNAKTAVICYNSEHQDTKSLRTIVVIFHVVLNMFSQIYTSSFDIIKTIDNPCGGKRQYQKPIVNNANNRSFRPRNECYSNYGLIKGLHDEDRWSRIKDKASIILNVIKQISKNGINDFSATFYSKAQSIRIFHDIDRELKSQSNKIMETLIMINEFFECHIKYMPADLKRYFKILFRDTSHLWCQVQTFMDIENISYNTIQPKRGNVDCKKVTFSDCIRAALNFKFNLEKIEKSKYVCQSSDKE